MSDQIELAARLREMEDDKLIQLVLERSLIIKRQGDFFDLAQAMLAKRKLEPVIRNLPRAEIENLRAGKSSAVLESQLLAISGTVLESCQKLANDLDLEPPRNLRTNLIARDDVSAMNSFSSILAITELLYEIESHLIRATATGIVHSDARWLSERVNATVPELAELTQLATIAGLAVNQQKRWQYTTTADTWLRSSLSEKWQFLIEAVLAQVKLPIQVEPGQHLKASLLEQYPLYRENHPLVRFGDQLSLTMDGCATNWIVEVMKNGAGKTAPKIASHMPAPLNTLVVQADLTMTAPGPLDTETERALRLFSETESIGIASSFRLSLLSLTHGLECGLSTSEMMQLLQKLSGAQLPQPVSYLFQEADNRFGKLVIKDGIRGCIVESQDQILLTQIMNEGSLKILNLTPMAKAQLVSRQDAESVYFNLREAGYPAIRVDSSNQVISPRVPIHLQPTEELPKDVSVAIARLRAGAASMDSGDPSDISRQLELAVKNKVAITVEVEMRDGGVMSLDLEPVSVAGGRLRAKDRKADAERTFPVSRIRSVVLG